jgi:hypothetical protein
VVYLDGAGSGAAVVDAMAGVDPGVTDTLAEVLAAGNTSGANNLIIDNGQAITTNTINETTAASGVTIDSVLLKDDGVNATNLEITNIKANDGTSAGSIADSTGVVTLASSVLTTADINGGTIDGTTLGATTPASVAATTGTFSGDISVAGIGTIKQIDSNSVMIGAGAVNLRMIDVTSDIRPVDSAGLGVDGTVDLGDANARFKDLYLSGAVSSGTITTTGAATFGGAATVTGDTIIIDSATHAFYTADRGDASSYAINRYYTAGTESWRVGLLNDGTSNFHIYDVAGSGDRLSIGTNGDISFYEDTGTTAKFFWDASTESLGIGTSVPTYKLNVLSDAGAQNIFQAGQSGVSNGLSITSDGTNLTYSFLTGNVGIGTSSPTAPLTVNGGTASAATIQLGNHNDNASIHGKYSLSFKADSTEAIADRSISFAIGTAANFALTTSTAIFNDLGADIDFRVESDGNENMLFVNGGSNRVGIGRDPQDNGSTLQVAADATASTNLQLTLRGLSNENKQLVLGFDTTANIASITSLEAGVDYRPLHLQGSEFVWNEAGSNHDFRVESDSNTHALFVDAGNSYVNLNSSATPDSSVAGFMFTADQLYTSAGAATTLNYQVRFYNGNGLVGAITTDGSATAYLTSSDQRLKENIADAPDAGDLIDAIQVRQFDWKADGEHQRYGMVAQELNAVAPEAVYGNPEDP